MKILLILLVILMMVAPAYASSGLTLEERVNELTSRVEALEALPQSAITGFTGQGNGQTMPFTITKSPWIITYSAELGVGGSASLNIFVCDPEKPESIAIVHGYGFMVSGNQTGSIVSYIPAGDYYFRLDTHGEMNWRIGYNGN